MKHVLGCLVLTTLLCASARADANPPYLYSFVDPPVILNDGITPFTLQVVTQGGGVASVQYMGRSGLVPLYDDGTHGDQKAGDGIYTNNGLTMLPMPLAFNGTIQVTTVFATITLANGQTLSQGVDMGVVGVGLDVQTKQLAKGITASSSAVFVVDPAWGPANGFDSNEASTNPAQLNFLSRATHALYSVLPDQFDFVVAMPGRPMVDATAKYVIGAPFGYPGNNQVQNIGWPNQPNDTAWGSSGKLQYVVYHGFGTGPIFTHEIGHRWGAYLGTQFNLSSCPNCSGAHWNANADIGGAMNNYTFNPQALLGQGWLAANGDGTWRLENDVLNPNGSFSMLDLYLMGLVPSSSVPPIHLLTNPNLSNIKKITADSVATYSVLQLTGGERVPDYQSSPKTFSTAFVIIKDKDFTPAEYVFFSSLVRFYTSQNPPVPLEMVETSTNPFFTATGGRGTMTAPILNQVEIRTNYHFVEHGGSFQAGPVAPGSLITVARQFTDTRWGLRSGLVYYSIDGVSVQFDGSNMRLYGLSPQQVDCAIPQNATVGVHKLTVTKNGSVVLTQQITITLQNLGALSWRPDPNNAAKVSPQILNVSGKLIGDPALSSTYAQVSPGDSARFLATGGGPTSTLLNDSTLAPPKGVYTIGTPQVFIDQNFAAPAVVIFAGREPSSFSKDRVVFRVPAGLSSGPHSVTLATPFGAMKVYKDALWIK